MMPNGLNGSLRYLVVDDEAPARQRIVDLLRRNQRTASVVEAASGEEAVKLLMSASFDVVFLDIQMPEIDGFQVIESVAGMPLTVFVTAYDQHALRAFEANALDYLLKPFGDDRFEAALARIQERFDEQNLSVLGQQVARLAGTEREPRMQFWDRLVIKADGAIRFLRTSDIEWVEAAGVYVTLHLAGRQILHRISLTELAAHLDPRRFLRVHRSAMVNLEAIVQLEAVSHGEFDALMKNGVRVRVSRTYRGELEERLGQSI